MNNRKYITRGIIVLIIIAGFRSVGPVEKIQADLRKYNAAYPEDKVYLQFDKPFYKPGEDIWFNAFVLNGSNYLPTTTSDVLYVELLDPKGNVAKKLELVIKEGTAYGDFTIDAGSPGGIYKVRAFTRWMKNDEATLFTKDIQVQKVITTQLLLKLDFEKESYGPGDRASAKLTVTNLKNEKAQGAHITSIVTLDGKQQSRSEYATDSKGTATIEFKLPDDLDTVDGLLQCVVTSDGVEESISRSIPIVLNRITLQFFPEGGNALTGLNNRIAFKALNVFGKGADISGSIVDESNTIITTFESFHMGMGAFDFTPQSGKKYFAKIERPLGNSDLIALPEGIASGLTMNLTDHRDQSISWTINSSGASHGYVVGQSHGQIYATQEVSIAAGKNPIDIKTDKFPAGIAVFTLFNDAGVEQCERLVFINKEKVLNIQLTPTKDHYLPGEKVELKIQTTDKAGTPVPAKLSLSVVDDQLISFADDKQDNMLSSLLLSSEVRGEIQEPSFYFDPDEPKAQQALDFLLMTQGWRRFTWNEIRAPKKQITYAPEKVKNISGRVVDSEGNGMSAEVALLELANRHRIVRLTSTDDGDFVFRNIDPTIPVMLLTRRPGEIKLSYEKTFVNTFTQRQSGPSADDDIAQIQQPAVSTLPGDIAETYNAIEEESVEIEGELDLNMNSDVSQLSEVVVTGYGTAMKSDLTGSVTTVRPDEIPPIDLEQALQGRVAGIMISPQTGNPGAQVNVSVRGYSSLAGGRNEPLYIVNGYPIGTSLSQNFANGSIFNPEDIESISVIHSPEAQTLYGSRGSNGAIVITTKSRIGYTPFSEKRRVSRYSTETVQPRQFSAVREFFTPPASKNNDSVREDFHTTLYWNHTIVTDTNGKAQVSFKNNDLVSAFRITAEGFSNSGLIGRRETVYSTQLPYSISAKIPEYLGLEDELKLPVVVKNETSAALNGSIDIKLPKELHLNEAGHTEIKVAPNSSKTYYYTVNPAGSTGDFPVVVELKSGSLHDQIRKDIHVQPVGFPMKISFSSKESDKTIRFDITDSEKNSVKAQVTAFPDALSDLLAGAESILSEPHGCFEQVSSSTFPNILALQFMKESGISKPEIESKAIDYIRRGYSQLVAYEIKGGGFEWFGHPAAHEALTAYGLIEFYEMKKVFNGVNDDMVNRTRQWLLSRRDGRGRFEQKSGKYGFAAASDAVNNAYIVYVLAETGTTDIINEYEHAYNEAMLGKDMYRLALMANASFALGRINEYNEALKVFKAHMALKSIDQLNIGQSVVMSYGESLKIETISLWALALLKSKQPDYTLIATCVDYILSKRSYGGFGSTQGTVLALNVLTKYAGIHHNSDGDNALHVFVGNTTAGTARYEKSSRDKIVVNELEKYFTSTGMQSMKVHFANPESSLPYSVDILWHTKKPQSSEHCKVDLSTTLNSNQVKVNETVRLSTKVSNKTSVALPMTMAVIGIPAGLSVQPWQLKELQEKAAFDFYEITDSKLILYYTEMGPNEIKTLNLDLKAEIQGKYTGSASCAYLYYENEHRTWIKGNAISVNQ